MAIGDDYYQRGVSYGIPPDRGVRDDVVRELENKWSREEHRREARRETQQRSRERRKFLRSRERRKFLRETRDYLSVARRRGRDWVLHYLKAVLGKHGGEEGPERVDAETFEKIGVSEEEFLALAKHLFDEGTSVHDLLRYWRVEHLQSAGVTVHLSELASDEIFRDMRGGRYPRR